MASSGVWRRSGGGTHAYCSGARSTYCRLPNLSRSGFPALLCLASAKPVARSSQAKRNVPPAGKMARPPAVKENGGADRAAMPTNRRRFKTLPVPFRQFARSCQWLPARHCSHVWSRHEKSLLHWNTKCSTREISTNSIYSRLICQRDAPMAKVKTSEVNQAGACNKSSPDS